MNELLIKETVKIGYKICKTAIWEKDRCTWVTKAYRDVPLTIYFEPMEADFYKGLSGVGLFLAALYDATKIPLFKKTAIGSIRQAYHLKSMIKEKHIFSFFRGYSGLLYTMIQVQDFCHENCFNSQIQALIVSMQTQKLSNSAIDVIEGLGSGIPTLIWANRKIKNKKLEQTIINAGDYLLELAEENKTNIISWKTIPDSPNNLIGFSHGTAGLATALLALYFDTKQKKYSTVALNAINYENNHFSPEHRTWVLSNENKHVSNYPKVYYDWAHGSAGIALARIRGFQYSFEENLKQEAAKALTTTFEYYDQLRQEGDYLDLSICNGLWGAIDACIEGHTILPNQNLLQKANSLVQFGMDYISLNGEQWVNDNDYSEEVPDFMLSLSGIGYTLLRMTNHKRYPSILSILATT